MSTYMPLAAAVEHLVAGGVLRDRDGDRYWLEAGRLMWDGLGPAVQVRFAFEFTARRNALAFAKARMRARGKQGRP